METKPKKSRKLGCFGAFVIVPALLLALYTWLSLTWNFSEGEHAGYVQKFSRRGWLCKTWEGELTMVTMPGSMPEKFEFSVRDDSIAAQINHSLGQRVKLVYEQHKGVPTDCFGETEYFVTAVEIIEGVQ